VNLATSTDSKVHRVQEAGFEATFVEELNQLQLLSAEFIRISRGQP